MRHDDLVCAHCSGLVSEGRCPVCRAVRDQYGQRQAQWLRTAFWTVVALLVALMAALVLQTKLA